MKKLISLVVCFAVMGGLFCSAKGDPLVGKWIHKDAQTTETYEFLGNGKGRIKNTLLNADLEMKYELLENNSVKLYMTNFPPVVFKYKVSAKELTLITPDGQPVQYQRIK